ncbi:MAG: DUF4062 domain-containing protein [Pirellulales bacterium]
MAKPRVFVSSTYYDLKHIRSSLDLFIESLGYEPILSEKGDIAYSPDTPLDESCYREATTADIFVLIIGGRYGSEASGPDKKANRDFNERYESITKKEYDTASVNNTPIYILIESSVYAEYRTYQRNKDLEKVNYAHVDSANVFRLIEEILAKPRNNPVHTFERFADIETWLRDQWAGLFRELLKCKSDQKQLAALTAQVENLSAVGETLKRYSEAILSGTSKEDSTKLIEDEEKRLEEKRINEEFEANPWTMFVHDITNIDAAQFKELIVKARSTDEFVALITQKAGNRDFTESLRMNLSEHHSVRLLNRLRDVLKLPPFQPLHEKPQRTSKSK